MIRFGSVCSVIEAASVSWEPLGWKAAWFSEIEPFPCAVLAHHWPDTPNLGDMTTITQRILAREIEAPDVFCGGTPCQAFSIAGKRGSLSDDRGNLSLIFCEIANAIDDIRRDRSEPASVIFWENVPGVLSTGDNAFGCFLAELAGDSSALEPGPRPEQGRSSAHWAWKKESGEHVPKWPDAGCVVGPRRAVAWRVLDAQFFGLAQRRRRVFVIASAREGFSPIEVLFEFEGVRRDSPPSREAWSCASAFTANGVGTCGADDNQVQAGHLQPVVATLDASYGRLQGCSGQDANHGHSHLVVEPVICMAHGQGGAEIANDRSPTLTCNHEAPIAAYSTNGIGSCVSSGGGAGVPTVAYGFSCKDHGADATEDLAPTMRAMNGMHPNGGGQLAVAFVQNSRDEIRLMGGDGKIVGALSAQPGMKQQCFVAQCVTGDVQAKGAELTVDDDTQFGCLTPYLPQRVRVHGDAGVSPTLSAEEGRGHGVPSILTGMAVRRLTPVECARLQGFPDNHCRIPTEKVKKLEEDMLVYLTSHHPDLSSDEIRRLAVDGPQYKAYGNSWAVNCTRWLGQRIDARLRACE